VSSAADKRRAREVERFDRGQRRRRIATLAKLHAEARSVHRSRRRRARLACGMGRLALRDYQRAERVRLRAEQRAQRERLRARLEGERRQARENCALAQLSARQVSGVEGRALALSAARSEQAETARIAKIWRSSRASKRGAVSVARIAQSDEAVARDIPPELVPVFERVKGSIRGGPRMSRTEAFLHWIHDNPEEAVAIQSEAAERDVDRLWSQLERERDEARPKKRRAA
jgi:hypothetical protein